MAFLGDLLIRLRAETADFQSDMGKAAYSAEKSMRQMQNAAASLGAVLSAGAFIAMVKNVTDAADHLGDLNKITGISVEQLSGLGVLAKQSGSDLDHMAKGINNMSAEIGKNPEKFKALGITAKDSMGAFKQFADVFNNLTDQTLKSAIASETFGHKHWSSVIPALSEGSKKIEEMVDKGSRLSGVTSEMARQADEFNDKLVLLSGTGGMLTRIVGPMLPLMNSLADDMLKASDKTKDLASSFSPLTEAFRAALVLGGNVSFVLKGIGTEIGGMMAQLAALSRGDFGGFAAIREAMIADAEKSRADFDAWERRVMGLGLTGAAAAGGGANSTAAADAAARARAFLGGSKGGKTAKVDPAIELALRNEQEIMREAGAATQKYYETVGKAIETQGEFLMQMETTSAIRVWSDLDTDLASASKQLDDYTNKARKTSEIGRELGMTFSSAFEDAILQGKRFQDVLKGIAQDILRIVARKMVTEPIAASISNAIGNLFPGKAAGGPVMGGHSYLVGESGPEIFTAGASGMITPNGALGGMVVNFAPVYNIDSRTDSATIARMLDMSSRQSEARLIEQLNRGQGGITQAVRRA